MEILYILAKVVELFIGAVSLCMFLRVILGIFADEENRLFILCAVLSEFFVLPFRVIMNKYNIMQDTPIDMPFMVAYLSLAVINLFLPVI